MIVMFAYVAVQESEYLKCHTPWMAKCQLLHYLLWCKLDILMTVKHAKPLSLSWPILLLKDVLINLNKLIDLLHSQLVTGIVAMILKSTLMLG